jgi:hypothetical protein
MSLSPATALARDLVRCPLVTPADAGALGALQDFLAGAGFSCVRQIFTEPGTPDVDNLFAKIGQGSPHLVFARRHAFRQKGSGADTPAAPFLSQKCQSKSAENTAIWLFVPVFPSSGADCAKAGVFSELYQAISGRTSTFGESQCCQLIA